MADYTRLTEDEIGELCRRYGLDCHSSRHIDGGMANSSFLVHCAQGDYILTVLDNHNAESASRMVELMRHLVQHGVATSVPVADVNGDHLAAHGESPVLVKRYLPGTCSEELPRGSLPAAGALLAAINLLRPDPFRFGLRRGRRLPADSERMLVRFADQDFARWLTEQLQWAGLPQPEDHPVGLVHGDFAADNIVVGPDGSLAVLDWETAAIDLPVVDLGMAIFGLCRWQGRFLPERAAALIEGYQRVRPIGHGEHELLLRATAYAALLVGYHRYVRHHIRHPAPHRKDLYREIPSFVSSLVEQWPHALG